MSGRVWTTSDDGLFDIVSLTPQTLEGGLEVMRKSFFIDENVSRAVELYKYPKAIKELEELTLRAAKDGCSIVAVEKSTGKVAAAAFNKLQVPAQPGEENYFENFEAKCKEPSAKSLVRFMIEADGECSIFDSCNVDCLLEIMFMATLDEYRGRGLGRNIVEGSVMLAKKLLEGKNVKTPIDESKLPNEPVPKLVSAIFTSFMTQKIGTRIGFKRLAEIPFDKWSFDGKKYSERIGPQTPFTTVEYYKL